MNAVKCRKVVAAWLAIALLSLERGKVDGSLRRRALLC